VTKINKAAIEIMGMRSADAALGKHVSEVLVPPHNNHLFEVVKEMLEAKVPQSLSNTQFNRLAGAGGQGQG